ncbi:hypothetical protein PFICI_11624 [Pestalotiopsis fici W106-1]|uniref:AA1-like domain-containing protein n=1 Tax=Pestalotiopsis fici (strain W106-1 / CGMCC3.15140) TaxID=1229662 RepID=W3WSY6_PESFW|nr:uncharacterized protein PFICI_11624 [Pestalotiopsis fici W106-1]ETS76237.1 hypothetical protein PFICI_11624 [Pestalotiopsis fici W106-1]
MQSFNFILASLAALGQAVPLAGRDESWQVTRFAAYQAAHSISEIVSFNVQIGSEDPTTCSGVGSGVTSSEPYLLPLSGSCVAGSGMTFNFTQVEDQAIRLDVIKTSDGVQTVQTYTSNTGAVQFVSTGDNPLDTSTSYTGPQGFALQA